MNSSKLSPILCTGTLFMIVAACSGVVDAPDESNGTTDVALCTSQVYWKEGDKATEAMNPGGPCNACHDKTPTAPNYTIAGTVYPTSHEPDNCHGVNGGMSNMPDVTVVITDKSGRTLPPIPVNSAGNFKLETEVVKPFWVKVVSKGKENKMTMQAPHGDCNACHTQKGAEGAPGRVVAP